MGCYLHNGDKEEDVRSTGNPLGCLLVLCPLIKVNGKLQQSNTDMMLMAHPLKNEGLGHLTGQRSITS